ncbi:hypothetical protein EVAR_46604_1 [Eumeta japonica]|uniref:Uncharacterized protein n=1 Tax=Eumeta variegata TaxID=151549 RepID=A0A4C1ZA33_EUMVA|nr:hypothetical protein EVAR_46604_1 [Eumeta japonica]
MRNFLPRTLRPWNDLGSVLLLGLSSALGGVSALLLLAVPVGRLTLTYPPAVELVARCDAGRLSLNHINDYPCEPQHPYAYDVTLTILSCGFVCELPQNTSLELANRIPYLQSYDIHIRTGMTAHFDYRHTVTSRRPPVTAPKADQSSSRLLKNDPYFNISISRVSETTMYFPAPNVYQMDCSLDSNNGTCVFGKGDILVSESNTEDMFRVRVSHKVQKLKKPVKKFWIEAISSFNRSHPVNDPDYDGVDTVTCNDNFSLDDTSGGLSEAVYVRAGGALLTRCASACAAAAPRKALCENQKQQIEIDPIFTFWTYLVYEKK